MEEVTSNTTIAVIMAYLDCYDMEYWWRNISSYQGFLPYRFFFCTGIVMLLVSSMFEVVASVNPGLRERKLTTVVWRNDDSIRSGIYYINGVILAFLLVIFVMLVLCCWCSCRFGFLTFWFPCCCSPADSNKKEDGDVTQPLLPR